jgi:hypothetical protein
VTTHYDLTTVQGREDYAYNLVAEVKSDPDYCGKPRVWVGESGCVRVYTGNRSDYVAVTNSGIDFVPTRSATVLAMAQFRCWDEADDALTARSSFTTEDT